MGRPPNRFGLLVRQGFTMRADRAPVLVLVLLALLVGSLAWMGLRSVPVIPATPTESVDPTLLARSPRPSPIDLPTAVGEATPWPDVGSMAPAVDDVLALAGRNGVAGMLHCANMPFSFDALAAPTDAEDRIGPEFDALRTVTGGNSDPAAGPRADPTYREVARDATHVLFLNEKVDADVAEAGRYLAVRVEFDGTSWRYAGGGDCQPRGVPSPEYGQATWTLDPDFRLPSSTTETLHLLVTESTCSGGRSPSGRISPAFVTWDPREMVIELFVLTLPGDQDCPGAHAVPATLRLPVALGNRTLFDAGTIGQGGSGG